LFREEKEPGTQKKMNSVCSTDSVVSFKNVNFYYREYATFQGANTVAEGSENKGMLLKRFSLQIAPGSFTAIVGPSGSGKSTVAKIAAGLLFPSNGDVCIYGRNPLENAERARQMVAYVSQTPYLFSGTIRDNLLMVKPGASEKMVKSATRMALVDDFIESLPNGYDTELSEQGNSLSGGQKQRLAIARAILADRPIWILDEATSALDQETELKVMQNLRKRAKEHNQTMVAVAHRLATVKSAHHTVVMEDGSIVQQGRHEELLLSGNNSLYRQMWSDHED
jgi:ABC-type multidrug transport system fused ATPase/permease subunit